MQYKSIFPKNLGSKKFRISLVNRPENRFLGGKNFLTPYFCLFWALSTRYLTIFLGSGAVAENFEIRRGAKHENS